MTFDRLLGALRRAKVLKRPLHVAAGKKWVTWLGVGLASVGAICAQSGQDIAQVLPEHGQKACLAVTLAGTLLASLGKGAADRRRQLPRDSGEPDDQANEKEIR